MDGPSILSIALPLALLLFSIYVGWRLFEKAGRAGWKILIPVYNIVVTCRIAGRPGWWAVLFLIPFVNLVPAVLVPIDLAKSFGKGPGSASGLSYSALSSTRCWHSATRSTRARPPRTKARPQRQPNTLPE